MPRRGRAAAVAPSAGAAGDDCAEPTTVATTTTASVGTAGDDPPLPPKKGGPGKEPPRSRGKFKGLPVVVSQHYCTRCAKRLSVEPDLVCKRRVGLKRCERCSSLGGRCEKTPTKYHPRVEKMQLAASAVVLFSAGCRAAAQAALNSQVREYTARVEGFTRRVGRGPPLSAYSHGE
ncbi:MAG: hypothetical protein M1826_005429, partial [Phylliscum demangeonii]